MRHLHILGLTVFLILSLWTNAIDAADKTCRVGTCSSADDIAEKYKTSELNTMLQWSALTYDYATIRKIVINRGVTMNPDKDDAIAFKKPELVVTQHSSKKTNEYDAAYLKYPITVHDIRKFVVLNQKYLVDEDGVIGFNEDGNGSVDTSGDGNADIETIQRIQQVDDEFPGLQIVEFNDRFRKSELVYSVIINPKEKRVTVVFRGSVTFMDWLMDASIFKTLPDEIKEFSNGWVGVHAGFAEYLFGEIGDGLFREGIGKTKFEQMVNLLKQIFSKKKYSKYKIYVTGHSLGGALTQLFAYTLAGSSSTVDLPKPINAISYASPRVGNNSYLESFKKLEKEGKLRHIRVSNDGDMVCVMPSFLYYQTGVNLHVRPNKRLEDGYLQDRNAFGQLGIDAISMHGLDVYHERLFREENEDILGMSIEQLYEKYAGFS